jgi:hypothetical protein
MTWKTLRRQYPGPIITSSASVMESILEAQATTILEFFQRLQGSLWVTLEEGSSAAWFSWDRTRPSSNSASFEYLISWSFWSLADSWKELISEGPTRCNSRRVWLLVRAGCSDQVVTYGDEMSHLARLRLTESHYEPLCLNEINLQISRTCSGMGNAKESARRM